VTIDTIPRKLASPAYDVRLERLLHFAAALQSGRRSKIRHARAVGQAPDCGPRLIRDMASADIQKNTLGVRGFSISNPPASHQAKRRDAWCRWFFLPRPEFAQVTRRQAQRAGFRLFIPTRIGRKAEGGRPRLDCDSRQHCARLRSITVRVRLQPVKWWEVNDGTWTDCGTKTGLSKWSRASARTGQRIFDSWRGDQFNSDSEMPSANGPASALKPEFHT